MLFKFSGVVSNPGLTPQFLADLGNNVAALTLTVPVEYRLPVAVSFGHISVQTPDTIPGGASLTATLYLNGAPTGASATILAGGTEAVNAFGPISFSAGDSFDVGITSTGLLTTPTRLSAMLA
jgi:hypothetical protein